MVLTSIRIVLAWSHLNPTHSSPPPEPYQAARNSLHFSSTSIATFSLIPHHLKSKANDHLRKGEVLQQFSCGPRIQSNQGYFHGGWVVSRTMQALAARRPLPWFRGPKLQPFQFLDESNRDMKFLEHLCSGLHGEVFRAEIDGSVYAVKLVCISKAGWLSCSN